VHRHASWPRTFTRCGHTPVTATLPGQISAARTLNEFRFREVTDQTAIYGVVGSPLTHSVSPAMHNAAFSAAGVDAVYVPMVASSAEDFTIFATGARRAGRQHHDSLQGRFVRARGPTWTISAAGGAVNTYRPRRPPLGGPKYRRQRVSRAVEWAPRPARLRARRSSARRRGACGCPWRSRLPAAAVTVYGRIAAKPKTSRSWRRERQATFPVAPKSWDLLVNTTP
jgi:hypothetical protein